MSSVAGSAPLFEFRRLAWPAYLVSVTMIAIPLVDAMTSLYPWQIQAARWRFGAVGLLSNALILPIAGLLIALVTAIARDHRVLRRLIGIVGWIAGVVAVGTVILFALDAVQTRAAVPPQMHLTFKVASWTAGLKTMLAAVTFLAIGFAALRPRGPVDVKTPSSVPLFSGAPPQRKSEGPAA